MPPAQSLIPELEEIVQHGSPRRRSQALERITTLFLDGASRFNEDHVRLFDDIFILLIEEIESKARAELSHRLAHVRNAPVAVGGHQAQAGLPLVDAPVLDQHSE